MPGWRQAAGTAPVKEFIVQSIIRGFTVAAVITLLFGCQGKQAATATGAGAAAGANEVTFTATDGWTIHADYTHSPRGQDRNLRRRLPRRQPVFQQPGVHWGDCGLPKSQALTC